MIARETDGPARLEARFAPNTFDGDARTVELTWSRGAKVKRRDWRTGEEYDEELDMSAEAIDLARLNAGAPLLNTHSQWDLDNVLGVVERAWVAGGEGRALVRFSTRASVAPIVDDVRAGILRNVSVGYSVEQWQTEKTAEGRQLRRAVRWTPHEISLVPIPADAGAQVRVAEGAPAPGVDDSATSAAPAAEESIMADNQPAPAQSAPDVRVETIAQAREEARAQERARVAELQRMAADAAPLLSAQRNAELLREAVAGSTTPAEFGAAILAAAAAELRAAPGGDGAVATSRIIRDEGDTARRAMQAGIDHLAGVTISGEEAELAGQMRGWRLIDFARRSVEMAGGRLGGAAQHEVAGAALGLRQFHLRLGMHSTSDFPLMLANTASKSLRAGYDVAPRTFTAWARRETLPDFKTINRIALGGAPALTQITEGGEIEFGTIGEAAETYRVFRFGRRVAVTFEAIVNDDLSGFTRVPQMYGDAASNLESTIVYNILNANPNMADNVALFAAGHNNVTTGVINVANLGAARAVMRKQTKPNGEIANFMPVHLIVPAELETTAEAFLSSTVVPAAPGVTNVNPWRTLNLVVEPRLTSATQWYLAASTGQVDTVEYAYLRGMEAPVVTSYTDEATDGVIIKCTHSFGAKAIDWRGMVRSSGV